MEITIYYTNWDGKHHSHELLAEAAGRWLKKQGRCGEDAIRLKEQPQNEKPCFVTPVGVEFSISHSGTLWMCAFGTEPVGLDIQKVQDCKKERLSARFFHPDEDRWLKHQGYEGFFSVWAAKESFLKFTGQGLREGMDFFSVVDNVGLCEWTENVCQRHYQFPGSEFGADTSEIAVCVTAKTISRITWEKL